QKLLQRAVQLRREQQHEQAMVLINQVLFLDPSNTAGLALKGVIEDSTLYRGYDSLKRRRWLEIAGQRLDSLEATTPYRDLLEYPADWPQVMQQIAGDRLPNVVSDARSDHWPGHIAVNGNYNGN